MLSHSWQDSEREVLTCGKVLQRTFSNIFRSVNPGVLLTFFIFGHKAPTMNLSDDWNGEEQVYYQTMTKFLKHTLHGSRNKNYTLKRNFETNGDVLTCDLNLMHCTGTDATSRRPFTSSNRSLRQYLGQVTAECVIRARGSRLKL